MKKILSIIMVLALSVTMLAGCSGSKENTDTSSVTKDDSSVKKMRRRKKLNKKKLHLL